VTTNARKQAARDHQRTHGVSYTEALRAVTPAAADGHCTGDLHPRLVDWGFLAALAATDVATFDPRPGWQRRGADPVLRLPIGLAAGAANPTTIDVDDDTHVLALIGADGAGKTVALQAIVLGLCALYPPSRVTFAIRRLPERHSARRPVAGPRHRTRAGVSTGAAAGVLGSLVREPRPGDGLPRRRDPPP
jgi:S-DNA-T family DNA segregation ATPase FtsK/SpoIIIE